MANEEEKMETQDPNPSEEVENQEGVDPKEESPKEGADKVDTDPKDDVPAGDKPDEKGEEETIPMHRFKQVYGKMREYERKLQESGKPAEEKDPQKDSPVSKGPVWEEYEAQGKTVEEFNRDYLNFHSDQRFEQKWKEKEAARQQQEQDRLMEERQTKADLNFQKRAFAAKAKYPDFEEKLKKAGSIGISFNKEIELRIEEAPNAEDLAYHLATNHEDAYKLMTLPREDALIELGVIKAKLEAGNGRPATKTTKAQEPVSPLSGNGKIQSEDSDDMSQEEFNAKFPPIF